MTPPRHVPGTVPGRGWYLVGLAAFLIGMAAMAALVFSRLSGMGDGMTQIVVPGEATVELAAGSHTIFHERRAVVDGRLYEAQSVSGLGVSVTGPGGSAIPVAAAGISGQYNIGGRQGFAAFAFTAPEAGAYRVGASYADGAAEPRTVIAVGGNFTGWLIATIGAGLALAFTGAGIFLAISLTILIRRRRAGYRF